MLTVNLYFCSAQDPAQIALHCAFCSIPVQIRNQQRGKQPSPN